MKNILLIATGGTIASKPTENGLTPKLTSDELLTFVPELTNICVVDAVQRFSLDSTNVTARHWLAIAGEIERSYDAYDGFVITHGTDTMAYTAAVLSYLIRQSRKPIVLTGSQKSIYERDSDARSNLISAFIYAADEGASGVKIVFDHRVILGTRARKLRTKSYNAFSSINFPEIARIRGNKVYYYIEEKYTEQPIFSRSLNPNVFVLKLIPGIDLSLLHYIAEHYDALVIESFGVGGLPCYGDDECFHALSAFLETGKPIVMTTQVPHEGSDMEVYEVGQTVKERFDLIEAYDMTLEAIVAKLMWILARTKDRTTIQTLFYTPIAHDLLFAEDSPNH